MADNPNPFVGMSAGARQIVERLLTEIHANGDWTDDHETMLEQWRAAVGEDAMTAWSWWAGEVGDDLMSLNEWTREAVIEAGRREYRREREFEIIEARMWLDCVLGDDDCWFAQSRNKEVVPVTDNDSEATDG